MQYYFTKLLYLNFKRVTLFYSGSMEPAFYRGDLLFLTHNEEDPVRVGDILVFRIEGREIPNVHRVIKIHEKFVLCEHFKTPSPD